MAAQISKMTVMPNHLGATYAKNGGISPPLSERGQRCSQPLGTAVILCGLKAGRDFFFDDPRDLGAIFQTESQRQPHIHDGP